MLIDYDKDGNTVPSQEYLSMLVILLRKSHAETGKSLVQFLENFEEVDETGEIDAYDDTSLRRAVTKLLKKLYSK